MMNDIRRIGESRRYSDVVIHNGTAHWVEVAEDSTDYTRGQVAQVLKQIDATLVSLGSDRTRLLQIIVFLADLADAPAFNEVWDAWVPVGHAPVRATVQAGLAPGYCVEMAITAAVESPPVM
jgi:enamine deaminase RidA (YjgF/YER057c/UK114 family)